MHGCCLAGCRLHLQIGRWQCAVMQLPYPCLAQHYIMSLNGDSIGPLLAWLSGAVS